MSTTFLDPNLLGIVFSFLYSSDDYESYVEQIRQWGSVNEYFHEMTRERKFLERFYYRMFCDDTIHPSAEHTYDECKQKNEAGVTMDANGFMSRMYPTTHWTHVRSLGKCKDGSHYNQWCRTTTSKFKDIFGRCRNKYLDKMIKKYNVADRTAERAKNRKRAALQDVDRYEDIIQKKQKMVHFKDMKDIIKGTLICFPKLHNMTDGCSACGRSFPRLLSGPRILPRGELVRRPPYYYYRFRDEDDVIGVCEACTALSKVNIPVDDEEAIVIKFSDTGDSYWCKLNT